MVQVLKPKVPVRRIVFHEITEEAVNEALRHPGEVNENLVRAQESRRILDRLYGYTLSPLLWKKVQTGLSAGRVQSVAVRLIVEREEERRAFHSAEYWDLEARLSGEGREFVATLVRVGEQRVEGPEPLERIVDLEQLLGVERAERRERIVVLADHPVGAVARIAAAATVDAATIRRPATRARDASGATRWRRSCADPDMGDLLDTGDPSLGPVNHARRGDDRYGRA